MRLDKDGTNPLQLYRNQSVSISHLTLDKHEKNIYWVQRDVVNKNRGNYYVNVNGGEVKKFEINGIPNYNGSAITYEDLQVDHKYVYFLAKIEKNGYFFRADKFNGKYDEDFEISGHGNRKGAPSLNIYLSKFVFLSN